MDLREELCWISLGWWGGGGDVVLALKKKKIDSPISFEIIRNCVGVV